MKLKVMVENGHVRTVLADDAAISKFDLDIEVVEYDKNSHASKWRPYYGDPNCSYDFPVRRTELTSG